jgi:hypothetical protein
VVKLDRYGRDQADRSEEQHRAAQLQNRHGGAAGETDQGQIGHKYGNRGGKNKIQYWQQIWRLQQDVQLRQPKKADQCQKQRNWQPGIMQFAGRSMF